jgi:hypothetical protein
MRPVTRARARWHGRSAPTHQMRPHLVRISPASGQHQPNVWSGSAQRLVSISPASGQHQPIIWRVLMRRLTAESQVLHSSQLVEVISTCTAPPPLLAARLPACLPACLLGRCMAPFRNSTTAAAVAQRYAATATWSPPAALPVRGWRNTVKTLILRRIIRLNVLALTTTDAVLCARTLGLANSP